MCMYTNDDLSIMFHRQVIVVLCSGNGTFLHFIVFCICLEMYQSRKGETFSRAHMKTFKFMYKSRRGMPHVSTSAHWLK